MRLKSFRIKNYKSIVDSGECRLLDLDGITVLAGQNESGKSSILQALRDYHKDIISEEAIRLDGEVPEVSCTYLLEKDDFDTIISEIKEYAELPDSIVNFLSKLLEFTLIKVFEDRKAPTIRLSSDTVEKLEKIRQIEISSNLKAQNKTQTENSDEEDEEDETEKLVTIDDDDFVDQIIYGLDANLPRVIFFDDFCDLLPDRILISDLVGRNSKASGYQAVKNMEVILMDDFTKLDTLGDARRQKAQSTYEKTITAKFNEKWTQKISEDDQAKIYIQYNQGKTTNGAYLNFFIETKDGEFLAPRQRSQGFRWFLSFYLQLKAESERNNSLIILFDEPGLFLHSRAQSDMVNVFEELSHKNQIIYSTHSPYLIDTSKLHRIKLVINSKEAGTTVEKITTGKVRNKKDSLKPIIDAMGLEVAHNFSTTKKRNVILEGITDFYYLEAFRRLLNIKSDFAFIPAMGAPNVHLLMELCIGWGLEWLIVFDAKGVTKEYNKIKKNYFGNNEDDAQQKILKLHGFDGIEDLFDDRDFHHLLQDVQLEPGKNKGDLIDSNGGKELVGRLFLEKVNTGEIKKSDLSSNTHDNFNNIFSFIQSKFSPVD
jgi:predicted ATP-dependent endonuclease of OLD family